MNLISRILRNFILLTVLLLILTSLSANWLHERGSPSDWLNDCLLFLEAQRKADQLERETEITLNRTCVKAKVAETLAKGEMKLIDAATVFRCLHEDPRSWHDLNRPLPDSKDAEAWCREVIEWAERCTQPNRSPSESEGLRQRLETELRGLRKRPHSVPLSE